MLFCDIQQVFPDGITFNKGVIHHAPAHSVHVVYKTFSEENITIIFQKFYEFL